MRCPDVEGHCRVCDSLGGERISQVLMDLSGRYLLHGEVERE
jgi:hypothetical protein